MRSMRPGRRYPERGGEAGLELHFRQLADLERDQQLARPPVGGQTLSDRLGLEALVFTERAKRVEQVAGQDAPVVEQQSAPVSVGGLFRSHAG